ncbi:MAG: glutamine synthetase family protein [Granulosicoccus sp.]|nr:glutamine synthetase family protein [Granulosicoccus sp.]
MPGNLTFDSLKDKVELELIDTVLAVIPDMQGRLMGKRFHAEFFVENAWQETHCCNYLVATDLEMETVDGYASTSWSSGYGDYVMKPDMTTLREVPWLEGTAMVICDLLDHHTHQPVPHSPRAVLQRQIDRLASMGLRSAVATELEFFVFRDSFQTMQENGYRDMTPISAYNEDYHIFQTTKEEGLMRQIRNGLHGAGVKMENTKGEACAGQAEVNVQYGDALEMADNHSIVKNGVKEIAFLNERAVTFLAKWSHDAAGSSSHIHQSLIGEDGARVFYDSQQPHGMSAMMRSYLAGLLAHAEETTFFLAPYVNSYKRFIAGTFAPTKIVWSVDNRTAGYRVVAPDSENVRVECRVGGSDLNPYLAIAAQLAAGIAGIEKNLSLEDAFNGDAYQEGAEREIPSTLHAATEALRESTMLRDAFGSEVLDHYIRAAEWELEDFSRKVTDYEVNRGFERA